MKKIILIGTAIAVLAVIALGVAGFAYAQTQTPPWPDQYYGPSMMQNRGFGPGMMGRWGAGGYGLMHEYMEDAFAEALGITHEELEAKLDAGETMWSITRSQGLSDNEITKMMMDARTKALDKAIADGILTQEQADWMIQRMQQMQDNGFGPGNCPMNGGAFGPGRGPAWRGNTP
jgi:hypothetical protein